MFSLITLVHCVFPEWAYCPPLLVCADSTSGMHCAEYSHWSCTRTVYSSSRCVDNFFGCPSWLMPTIYVQYTYVLYDMYRNVLHAINTVCIDGALVTGTYGGLGGCAIVACLHWVLIRSTPPFEQTGKPERSTWNAHSKIGFFYNLFFPPLLPSLPFAPQLAITSSISRFAPACTSRVSRRRCTRGGAVPTWRTWRWSRWRPPSSSTSWTPSRSGAMPSDGGSRGNCLCSCSIQFLSLCRYVRMYVGLLRDKRSLW